MRKYSLWVVGDVETKASTEAKCGGPSTAPSNRCAHSGFGRDDAVLSDVEGWKNKQQQRQRPMQMRGSLHCAAHDETVSGFGRDDAVFCYLSGCFLEGLDWFTPLGA